MKKIYLSYALLICLIVLMVTFLIFSPCSHAAELKTPTVKLGWSWPFTGPVAESASATFKAIPVAIAEINETVGINGYKVEIVSLDDTFNKVNAVNNFKKLAAMDNIISIGCLSTGIGLAFKPLNEQFKIIQLNSTSIGDWPKGLGEWVFRNTNSDKFTIPFLLKAVKERFGVKTVGVMFDYVDDFSVFCVPIIRNACKDLGLELVAKPQSYARGDTDFSAQLRILERANPDFIILPAQQREGSLIVKQARMLGVKSLIGGTSAGVSLAAVRAVGDAADGVINVDSFHKNSKNPEAVHFYRKFKQMFPDVDVNDYATPLGYDIAMMACIAARRANIKPPVTEKDRIAVRDEFAKIKGWKGAAGTYTFEGPGDALPRDCFLQRYNAKTKFYDLVE
jgi:branched-chain amino acid transport system substrate-binding protein